MNARPTLRLVAILALLGLFSLLLAPSVTAQPPLGTAFSYQGRLHDSGAPASGTFDLLFTPYGASVGGDPLADPVTLLDVPVTGGLFTVQLDFGDAVFTGDACWLEIGVKDAANDGPFTTLVPRQRVTPTPYAIHAATAGGINAPLSSGIQLAENVSIERTINGKLIFRVDGAPYELSTFSPWKHPRDFSDHLNPTPPQGSSDDFHAAVAMGNGGHAIIAWVGAYNGRQQIYYSYYDPVDGWRHPVNSLDYISTGTYDVDYRPQVAIDDQGNALIVWAKYINAEYFSHIYMSEYRNGTWNHPDSLDDHIDPDGGSARLPSVAMDDTNHAFIAWSQEAVGRDRIFVSAYRSGPKGFYWSHPDTLNDYLNSTLPGDADFPKVVMSTMGLAMLVWHQNDNPNDYLFVSEYSLGAWHNPLTLSDAINPPTTSSPDFIPVLSTNGDAVVAYSQREESSGHYRIYISERRDDVWTYPSGPADHISPPGDDARYPTLAINERGNTLLFWSQSPDTPGANSRIMQSYQYGVTGSWNHPDSIDDTFSDPAYYCLSPEIAYNNNGNAICIWSQSFAGFSYIVKADLVGDYWLKPTARSDAVSLYGNPISPASHRVAIDDAGQIIILWAQGYTYNDLFLSEYRPLP